MNWDWIRAYKLSIAYEDQYIAFLARRAIRNSKWRMRP